MGRSEGTRRPRLHPAILLLVLLSTAAAAQPELGERLVALRGEVERLDSELVLLREEQRTLLAGLNAQRAELEASLDRQRRLTRDLAARRAAAEDAAAQREQAGQALRPVLEAAIDREAARIRGGLPFKVEERVAALEEIRRQMADGTLSPGRAASRLWAFFEDELRGAREVALHSQTVVLGGERVLADVVKVGSMALYFRTPDGRFGQAVRSGGGWDYRLAEDASFRASVAALFDALRKQIRRGWFQLPQLAAAEGQP